MLKTEEATGEAHQLAKVTLLDQRLLVQTEQLLVRTEQRLVQIDQRLLHQAELEWETRLDKEIELKQDQQQLITTQEMVEVLVITQDTMVEATTLTLQEEQVSMQDQDITHVMTIDIMELVVTTLHTTITTDHILHTDTL